MSDLLKAAGFIALPFIGSIPGGIITKKAMGWYDVSNLVLNFKDLLSSRPVSRNWFWNSGRLKVLNDTNWS
jgi:hypothetical protein